MAIAAAIVFSAALGLQGCQKKTAEPMAEAPAAAPMHKAVITAEVNDAAAWESAYRSHGELFRSQGTFSPILLGTTDENVVGTYEEFADVDAFNASLASPETREAMEADGVKVDSLRAIVLDKEFAFGPASAEPAATPLHKVVITATVADPAAWEASFRTHGDLFASQGAVSPIQLGVGEDNVVAVYEQTADLDKLLANLESPETDEAMKADGVMTDTVRVVVLDKTFSF
jgi:quinol monooxygenase YgiN